LSWHTQTALEACRILVSVMRWLQFLWTCWLASMNETRRRWNTYVQASIGNTQTTETGDALIQAATMTSCFYEKPARMKTLHDELRTGLTSSPHGAARTNGSTKPSRTRILKSSMIPARNPPYELILATSAAASSSSSSLSSIPSSRAHRNRLIGTLPIPIPIPMLRMLANLQIRT